MIDSSPSSDDRIRELDVAVDAIKLGAFDFITKPYNPDYLLHSVEKAVKYTGFIKMEKNYKRLLEETVRLRTQELADALMMVRNMSNEIIQRLTPLPSIATRTPAPTLRIAFTQTRSRRQWICHHLSSRL
jgi:response regulator RpfG family c-di-GMP phosphodiesterase